MLRPTYLAPKKVAIKTLGEATLSALFLFLATYLSLLFDGVILLFSFVLFFGHSFFYENFPCLITQLFIEGCGFHAN